jgi:glycosyltransferase involved in cell wall biosynthesis
MSWKIKKDLCFVVQRYGEEISGGAEALCAQYVERLKEDYHITVATSCAKDYNSWENEYPSGFERKRGVNLYRFLSAEKRDPEKAARLTLSLYSDPYHDLEQSAEWLRNIGPDCPGITRFVRDHEDRFDLFVFIGYLYFQTTFGLPLVSHKAVLIPTAHDEDAINRCNYFNTLFNIPAGIIYLTQEEKEFVQRKFSNKHVPSLVAGAGVDVPEFETDASGSLPDCPYIVYIGRIDDTKDCSLLIDSFVRYKEKNKDDISLVLVGERFMELPSRNDIIDMGFVDEKKKFKILSRTSALVLPSRAESLSIVTLEAMALGIPVLLRKSSAVLEGHVKRSGAGLCFDDEKSFEKALQSLLSDSILAQKMGENGARYVQKYYNWDIIIEDIKKFFDGVITERT